LVQLFAALEKSNLPIQKLVHLDVPFQENFEILKERIRNIFALLQVVAETGLLGRS
jgi:hypothetical protein